MAFTNITLLKRASDLVVDHEDHNFSNANANITPPAGSAQVAAQAGNTGNAIVGTVTVAGAYAGVYAVEFLTATTFNVFGPKGNSLGQGATGATFTGGGLSFTITVGATPMVAGDGFNITVTAGAAIPFGTVVFRAKGQADTAAWTVLTAAADLVTTNEFAVVFGSHYGFAADFVPRAIAAGKYNAIVVRRDAALKEYYIKAVHGTQLGADYPLLVSLLNAQGLLVLDDVSELTI